MYNCLFLFVSQNEIPRRRLATEPGLESGYFSQMSPLTSSPNRSSPFVSPDQQTDGAFIDDPSSQSELRKDFLKLIFFFTIVTY